jgi:hypothetical protein
MAGEVFVTLTPAEWEYAASIGIRRHIEAVTRGWPDKHGYNGFMGEFKHILGARGELAVAKALGTYWPATINTFAAPDVSDFIQVRTRGQTGYTLLVRKGDQDDHAYVGVVPCRDLCVCIIGWLWGAEAKSHPEWLQSYGGREDAYFPPREALQPLADLGHVVTARRGVGGCV